MNKKQQKLVKALIIFSILIIGVIVALFFMLRKPEIELKVEAPGDC